MKSQKNNSSVSSNQELQPMSSTTFEQVVKQYEKYIEYFTNKYTITGYTRDDIKQVVLMAFYRAYTLYDGTSKFTTFATSLARNELSKVIQNVNKQQSVIPNEIKLDRFDGFVSTVDIERELITKELSDKLWDFVGNHRFGIIARYIIKGKMKAQRVADILHLDVNVVRQRYYIVLREARKHFADELEGYIV